MDFDVNLSHPSGRFLCYNVNSILQTINVIYDNSILQKTNIISKQRCLRCYLRCLLSALTAIRRHAAANLAN